MSFLPRQWEDVLALIQLYRTLLPLDAFSERIALADHFCENNWVHYSYKAHDPGQFVCPIMQKSLANPDRIMLCWNKGAGRPEACDWNFFEEKHKQYLAQNLGMVVGLDKSEKVATKADLKAPESTDWGY